MPFVPDEQQVPISGFMPDEIQPKPPLRRIFGGLESVGQGVSNFLGLGGAARGLAGAVATLEPAGARATQSAQKVSQLLSQAQALPIGSPQKKLLLSRAQDVANHGVELAESLQTSLAQSPTALQTAGSFGKLGLTTTSFGGVGIGGRLAAQAIKGGALGAAFGVTTAAESGKTGKELIAPTVIGGTIGAAVPLVVEGVKQGFQKVLPKLSRYLEQENLRLTPTQKSTLGKKLDDVTEFMSKEKIIGSPESRFDQVDSIYNDTENKLQNFLNRKSVTSRAIDKEDMIAELEILKANLMKDSSDAPVIERQIDDAIANVRQQYLDKIIPVNRLNRLKRSTYQNAYNQAGNKVLDDVEHAIGDVYKDNIEKATKGLVISGKSIGEFNKEYGTIINARKLLRIAQGRNQLGIFGRFIVGLIGAGTAKTVGLGPVGEAVGFGTEEIAKQFFTPVRSLFGAGARTASEVGGKVPSIFGETIKRVALPSIFSRNK